MLVASVFWCALVPSVAHAQGETLYVDIDVENGNFDGSSWGDAFLTLQNALDVAGPDDEIWVAEGTYYPTNTEDRTISFEINGDQDGLKIYGGFDPDTGDTDFADRNRFANETILSGWIGDDILFGPIRSHQVVVFAQNGTTGPSGGAITRDTVIDGFIIEEGSADTGYPYRNGGAIYINGRGSGNEASPTISNMILRDNLGLNGGAVGIDGTQGGRSSPLLTNVTFIRNQTPLDGGAVYGRGSGTPVIKNSVFVENKAVDLSGAGPNYAYGGSIAVRAGSPSMHVINTLFANNESKRGGAIYTDANMRLTNVTIAGNTASEFGGAIVNNADLVFENSIAWGNTAAGDGDEIYDNPFQNATTQYTHALVQGLNPAGTGNLDGTDAASAPGFPNPNNPEGPDGILATIDDGFRLGENSPAIDAGDNSLISEPTDLTGRQRVQNGTVNLGPYEEAADTPERIYVDATAMGAGDGTSWSDAHPNLQDALDRAGGNDRIWIAQGTYYPDEGGGRSPGDRAAPFYIPGTKDGLQLYGGFEGTEDALDDRDVRANETVLSGDINQSGTATGNSYTVVQLRGQGASDPITAATTLADLTITAGNADGSGLTQERGAGLYCDGSGSGNACSPTLQNVVFAEHTASFGGSALFNDGRNGGTASPQIEGVLFTDNTADVNGGAIYNYGRGGESSPTIVNSTFSGNTAAASGGAMYNYAYTNGVANLTINNTIWYGNTADSDNNGTGAGAQIYNDGNDAVLNFRYSLFEGTGNDVESVNGARVRYEEEGGISVTPISVSTNVQADPAFVDANAPAGPDAQFGTLDDGLRLAGGSPALSFGENSAVSTSVARDLIGEDRIQNSQVSLGPYERASGIVVQLTATTGAETASFSLTHEGASGITGANVDLGLPSGITTPSATGAGSVSGGTWTVDVPANDMARVTVDLERTDSAPTGVLDLTAQLDTDSYTIDGGSTRDATQPSDAEADWTLLEAPYGPGIALTLDGTDDYLRADAVAAELANADAYTMSAWVRPTNTDTGQRGIVAFHTGTGGNKNMLFYRNERFAYYDSGIGYQESATTYAPGTWHHVVVTVDASDNGTLYVDGNAEATFSANVRPEAGDRFSIGQEWDGDTASDFFEGQIDEVRVWTAARTEAEIRASTYQTVPPERNELAAYYRFDAAQTGQRLDESYAGAQAYDLAQDLDASFEGDLQWTASGARLGQQSVVVDAGNTASLGPADAQLTLTSTDARTTLYRYGNPSADVFTDLDVPRKTTRSNAVWGAVPTGTATLELTYATVAVPNPASVGLAERPYPTNAWTARPEEPVSQTFTLTDQTDAREFALYDNGPPFYYVHANATGANTGASFADAFTELQDALAVAKSSEIIVIAGGTYKPGPDRTDTFRIDGSQDGVTIAGGFEGTESFDSVAAFESALPARDFAANETILSGNLGVTGLSDDDAYHVLFVDGTTSGSITNATTLNGLTITAGNADGSGSNAHGGGLYCNGSGMGNACAPTIRTTQFVDNTATSDGGALYNNGSNGGSSSPRILNSAFADNQADHGGALYNNATDGTSSPELINTVFADNTADRGGAIYNDASDGTSSPTLVNATLTGNTAAFGGAVYSSASGSGTSVPDIVNTILWDNTATDTGNDVYSTNGAAPAVRSTLVAGGCPTDADCGDGSTLLTEDPLFAEPSTPPGTDGVYGTGDDGLALTSASPALDAGDDSAVPAGITTDLVGETRIQDSNDDGTPAVTVGAYEQVPPSVIFVDADATGAANGSSFDDAYPTLQDALDVARGSNQIWIAEGTYRPTAEANAGEPRSATFQIADTQAGLQIYGGFAGNETISGISDIESILDSRDLTANPTILSGDIGTPNDPSDNAYHVVSASNLTAETQLDGLTITGGNANGTNFAEDAGGGIYSSGSNLTLNSLIVTENAASEEGGGLSASNSSTLHITHAVFAGNDTGAEGGAVALTQSPAQMTNVVFAQNTAGDRGGALYANSSDTQITNATFTGNTAATFGNALVNFFSSFTVTNSVLWGNGDPGSRQLLAGDPLTLSHTLVEGGESGIGGTGEVTYVALDGSDAGSFSSSSNRDANPRFADASVPAGSDGQFATSDDGLRLTNASAALARGTFAPFESGGIAEAVTTDLAGAPRRFGLFPDLGAYEFSDRASTNDQITGASDLVGYVEPPDFEGLLLLRDATNGDLTLQRTDGRPSDPNGELPNNVAPFTWTINLSSGTPAYDLVLYADDVPDIGDFSTLQLYKSDDNGQTWEEVSTLGARAVRDASRNFVAAQDLVGFSQFAIASSDPSNPLPVELAGFEAQRSGPEAVTVQWETLSETNNAGFEVQRAAGAVNESVETPQVETPQWDVSTGGSWEPIATLDGAGTTDIPQSYRFEDANLPYAADSLSYRLRQVDTNGTESFSDPVTIARQVTAAELLPTYPNPVRGQATVRYAVPNRQDVRIDLYDLLGRRIRTVVDTKTEGRTEAQLDVSRLASGTYFLRMQTEAGPVDTQRVTVVR